MSYTIPQYPVESSNIRAMGYDVERKVLAITFKSGDVWHYGGVSYELAEQFHNAESKGKFYVTNLRGKFSAEKMTGHCPRCGMLGLIGETCTDCGCAQVERDPRPTVDNEDGTRTPIGATK